MSRTSQLKMDKTNFIKYGPIIYFFKLKNLFFDFFSSQIYKIIYLFFNNDTYFLGVKH